MSKDYKVEQKKYRELARKTRVLWSGGTLDMSIRKFKKSMSDNAEARELVRIYKANAWNGIEVKEA